MCITHVEVAGIQDYCPEPIYSNGNSEWFLVSFSNRACNLMVTTQCGWFLGKIYISCAFYVYTGCTKERPKVEVYKPNARGGQATTIQLSPRSVYNLDIPRMSTATMRRQNNCIILDFRNRKKYLKLPFWIRPASWQVATELERTSSCCSDKHKKRWKAPAGSIHASNNHYKWKLFCRQQVRLPLKDRNMHTWRRTTGCYFAVVRNQSINILRHKLKNVEKCCNVFCHNNKGRE